MLREKIDDALKRAMKARDDKIVISTLRLINAAIKDRDIAARACDRCDGVTDDEIQAILAKMVRQREESSAAYDAALRPELAEQEREEITVIRQFMPKQMTEQEISEAVAAVVSEIGAQSLKDMGKCMGALKERHAGAMDFSRASALVKQRLAG